MPTSPLTPEERERKTRRLIMILVLIVLAVTTIAALDKAWRGKSAFMRWRPLVVELVQGENVYEKYLYPNTPAVGLMLYPLAKLPPFPGAIGLYLLKVAMAGLSIYWAIGLATGRRGTLPAAATGLILLLCARPIMSDLQHGNINILILFLVMAALRLFSRDRTFLCGMLIGLAVVIKVTPGLFLPYFLYKRQWRTLVGAALGGVLALVIPAMVLGWQHNIDMHVAWFDQMIRPYALEGKIEYTDHINQSLPGVFFRFVTESPGVNQSSELGYAYINVLSLDVDTAKLILRGMLLAMLAWMAIVCRSPTGDRRDWRLACEFSLIVIGMLLFSERSWKHHYVTMTLPFAVMVAHGYLSDPPAWLRRIIQAVIIFALVMMLGMNGPTIGWMYHGIAHKFVEGYGSYFWYAIGSFLVISMILLQSRSLPDPESPDTPDTPISKTES